MPDFEQRSVRSCWAFEFGEGRKEGKVFVSSLSRGDDGRRSSRARLRKLTVFTGRVALGEGG